MNSCKLGYLPQRMRKIQHWYKFRLWNWTWAIWGIKLGRRVNWENLRETRSHQRLKEMTSTETRNSTPISQQLNATMKIAPGTSSAHHASEATLSKTTMAATKTSDQDQNLKTPDLKDEACLPNSTPKRALTYQSRVIASLTECLKKTLSNIVLLVAHKEEAARSMVSMEIKTQLVYITAKTERCSCWGTRRTSIRMRTRIMEWLR